MISQEYIDFLKEVGGDKKSWEDKSLLDHLIETHDILKDNGAPEYLQKARFVSFYLWDSLFYGWKRFSARRPTLSRT